MACSIRAVISSVCVGKRADVWILAEKIIEPGEPYRREWPIDGTTGYDYLNQAGGLFVDSSNEEALTKIYSDFTGETADYAAVCREKKHMVDEGFARQRCESADQSAHRDL